MIGRAWGAWGRFWFEPVSPSSICVFRVAFGVLSLLNSLLFLPDFMIWFSDGGAAPPGSVARVQPTLVLALLQRVHPGDGFYISLLLLEILGSGLVALGLFTKPSLLVVSLARLILHHRNPLLWHQVDILLRYYGPILLLCPCGEMYSLDRWLCRRGNPAAPLRHFAPWGQRMIELKLSLIYAEAFSGKIVGQSWLDGTAVYYATHFLEGVRHPVPAVMDHLVVYQALTYFTLAIEFSLAVLIWFPRLRYPILLGGLLFHLGIHAFISLDLLEPGVVIAYLCFVDPRDMERFVAACRGYAVFRMRSARAVK
jgi:hypothetical protein